MSDSWSKIIENDGKIQVKPRIGFAIPAPDRVTASKIAMALDTVTGPPPEAAARGREAASAPAARAKMASTKRGRAAHPETAKALREAAKRPKPKGWGARANAWMRHGKRGGNGATEQPTDCD